MLIAVCAGEASGDKLAASLITELKMLWPAARFIGMVGPAMLASGCEQIAHIDQLSVMGVVEVLKQLPRLLKLRCKLTRQILALNPDLFIGVDAPDFMLSIERKCKRRGIPTVHYVSPTVWAWRERRIKSIKRAVDLMLTLFPFEEAFYQSRQMNAVYVGHPLADEYADLSTDTVFARQTLSLTTYKSPVIALLPGSRSMEIDQLGEIYLETIRQCQERMPDCQFVIPAANTKVKNKLVALLHDKKALPVTLIDGQLATVVKAADVVLVTSGTATLEAMLLGKPMVVAYKMSRFNWFICRCFVHTPFCALPNLLAGKQLVPEYVQTALTPHQLTDAICHWLNSADARQTYEQESRELSSQLRQNAARRAAHSIAALV